MPRKVLIVWWITCLIWSTVWLAIKIGVHDLPPLSFAGYRLVVAIAILLPIVLSRPDVARRLREEWRLLASTGVLLLGVNYALVFWGAQYVSSGLIAVLQATTPLFGVGLSYLIARQPIRRRQVMATAIGLIGLVVIFSENLQLAGKRGLLGAVAIAGGAFFVALTYVLVGARGKAIPPLALTTGQMIAGCIPLIAAGAILEGSPLDFRWTRAAVLSLLYLAIAGSVAGFLLNYWLLQRADTTSVLSLSIVEPLFAVLLGALVLRERLSWHVAIGGAAVLLSAWMILSTSPPARRNSGQGDAV